MSLLALLSFLLLGCNNANKGGCDCLNSQENTVFADSVAVTDSVAEAVNKRELYERKKAELRTQMISFCLNEGEKEQVDNEWTAYENVERQMINIASNLGHLLCWGGASGPAYVTNSIYKQVVEARIEMYKTLVEIKQDSIPDINGAYYAATENFFFDCMDSTLVKAEMMMKDEDRFNDDEDRHCFVEKLEETKSDVRELKNIIPIWKNILLKSEFFESHTLYENVLERLASKMLIKWACAVSD